MWKLKRRVLTTCKLLTTCNQLDYCSTVYNVFGATRSFLNRRGDVADPKHPLSVVRCLAIQLGTPLEADGYLNAAPF